MIHVVLLATFTNKVTVLSHLCPPQDVSNRDFPFVKMERESTICCLLLHLFDLFRLPDVIIPTQFLSYVLVATQLFNHCTIRSVFASCCSPLSLWRTMIMSCLYDSCASERTTCIISASLFS